MLLIQPVAIAGQAYRRASVTTFRFLFRFLCVQNSGNSFMDWSSIQGSILTGGGRLEELFQAPRFPWRPDELPHYHKVSFANVQFCDT
jgi:hypothetical protein